MPKMHRWMGLLFGRGVSPLDLQALSYPELKYWGEWAQAYNEAEKPKESS